MNKQGYINSGSTEAALAVYDELLRQGLEPDRLTFNTLISACVKAGNLDRAIVFFEEMKVVFVFGLLNWSIIIFWKRN